MIMERHHHRRAIFFLFETCRPIFVDPEAAPLSGRYVVVRLEDSHEATFKQLIVEGDRQYLKAVNPDWPQRIIEVDSNATIYGVVVFKGEVVQHCLSRSLRSTNAWRAIRPVRARGDSRSQMAA